MNWALGKSAASRTGTQPPSAISVGRRPDNRSIPEKVNINPSFPVSCSRLAFHTPTCTAERDRDERVTRPTERGVFLFHSLKAPLFEFIISIFEIDIVSVLCVCIILRCPIATLLYSVIASRRFHENRADYKDSKPRVEVAFGCEQRRDAGRNCCWH